MNNSKPATQASDPTKDAPIDLFTWLSRKAAAGVPAPRHPLTESPMVPSENHKMPHCASIGWLHLGHTSHHALMHAGIITVGDLVCTNRQRLNEVLEGRASLIMEVISKLTWYGYTLADDPLSS